MLATANVHKIAELERILGGTGIRVLPLAAFPGAPEVAEEFVNDLQDAVAYAKHPKRSSPRSGALYGLGGTPEGNEILDTLFTAALDAMYEVAPTEARA